MKKISIKPLENSIFYYILITLTCLNFAQKGAVFSLCLGLFCFIIYWKIETSAQTFSLLLLIISISITTIYFDRGVLEIIKAFNFILLYLAGKNGFLNATDKKEFVINTLFCIFLASNVQLLLHLIYNLNRNINDGGRVLYSIWTKKQISVTIIGPISAACIGFAFYGCFINQKKFVKVVSVLSMALILYISGVTSTRTPVLLSALIFFAMSIISLIKLKGRRRKKILFDFFIMIITIIIVLTFLSLIRGEFFLYPLLDRFKTEGLQSGRIKIALEFFRNMPNHLFGGENIKEIVGYDAHNYLQQGYDLYGIIAFIALMMMTIHIGENVYFLLRRKQDIPLVILIVSMMGSLFIQCVLEPILTSYPICFWFLLMLDGIAAAMNETTEPFSIEEQSK